MTIGKRILSFAICILILIGVGMDAAVAEKPVNVPCDRQEPQLAEKDQEHGFYFVGVRLHAIDENGNEVVNACYEGLPFNNEGEVTSGSEELDELIWAVMEEHVDPSVESRETMLRVLYNYTVSEFRYRGRNVYKSGETGWEQEEALVMLNKKKGNCYSFAAVFYYFARALGYNASIYSGTVYGQSDSNNNSGARRRTPHGWVEIEGQDGNQRIYDPEMEYVTQKSFWAKEDNARRQYGYKKAEPES